jgi:hypothetical protein
VLTFDENPFFVDDQCPVSTLYGISVKDLFWAQLNDWDWLDQDGNVLKWESRKDRWIAILAKYSQLGTTRRNAHAVLTGDHGRRPLGRSCNRSRVRPGLQCRASLLWYTVSMAIQGPSSKDRGSRWEAKRRCCSPLAPAVQEVREEGHGRLAAEGKRRARSRSDGKGRSNPR